MTYRERARFAATCVAMRFLRDLSDERIRSLDAAYDDLLADTIDYVEDRIDRLNLADARYAAARAIRLERYYRCAGPTAVVAG